MMSPKPISGRWLGVRLVIRDIRVPVLFPGEGEQLLMVCGSLVICALRHADLVWPPWGWKAC